MEFYINNPYLRKRVTQEKCVICGNIFIKRKKGDTLKKVYGIRGANARTCSVSCSKIHTINMRDRRKK